MASDAESEADFLGLAPDDESNGPEDPIPEDAVVLDVVEQARRPRWGCRVFAARRRWRTQVFAAPSQRTPAEHAAISAKMHLGKARKQVARMKQFMVKTIQSTVDYLKHRAIVRCGVGLVVHKKGRSGMVQVKLTQQSDSRSIAASAILGAAFSQTTSSCNMLAKQWQIHPRSVNRCRALAASVYLQVQSMALTIFKKRWEECAAQAGNGDDDVKSYCISSFRFDETSERFSMPVSQKLKPHQQESS